MSTLQVPLITVTHDSDDDGDAAGPGADATSIYTDSMEWRARAHSQVERRARAHSQVDMVKKMVPGLSSVAASSFTFANFILAPGE